MITRYRNSFHTPFGPDCGPEFFEVEVRPTKYRGFLIYHRLRNCFDIVVDGVCIGMYAGMNGAKRYIDGRIAAGRGAA